VGQPAFMARTASVVAVDMARPLPANTNVRLAITGVSTIYPGTDLTVFDSLALSSLP
jgi:hypothetical protein